MLLEQTHDKLIAMKLFGMAAAMKERLARRDHQDLSKPEFFGLLVDDEWLYRQNRKLSARLKVAKFKQRSAAVENRPPDFESTHNAPRASISNTLPEPGPIRLRRFSGA